MVSVMKVEKGPLESYADIGSLDAQIQEIEAVELPLTHPELYEDIGIKPPKGVIFYGEAGTGKTLLAKVSFVSAGDCSGLRDFVVLGCYCHQCMRCNLKVRPGVGIWRRQWQIPHRQHFCRWLEVN